MEAGLIFLTTCLGQVQALCNLHILEAQDEKDKIYQ